jgi:hypothetical protein
MFIHGGKLSYFSANYAFNKHMKAHRQLRAITELLLLNLQALITLLHLFLKQGSIK